MGEPTDDHAADLSHIREVHDVVGNLRRLLEAAAKAEEAGVAPISAPLPSLDDPGRSRPSQNLLQSPLGR